jgi:IclR family transcriptional regulator, pca regulon regulatory protein
LSWPDAALPHVERLVADVEDASEVGILDGTDVVFILRVPGPQIMNVAINIGARLPAHYTALGKVLLAGLSDRDLDKYFATAELTSKTPRTITSVDALRREVMDVRAMGFATCDQELEEGLRAIAVPIQNRSGQTVAALNVSSHVVRRSMEGMRQDLLPRLQATVAQINNELFLSSQSDPRLVGRPPHKPGNRVF